MAQRLYGKAVSPSGVGVEPLRPAPIPRDTFTRPVQRDVGGNATRLADALQGLSASLGRFGSIVGSQQNDPNSRENIEMQDRWNAMTPAERQVEADKPANRHWKQQRLLDQLRGVDHGTQWREDTKLWMADPNGGFDPNGDVRGQLTARREEFGQFLGSDAQRAAANEIADNFIETATNANIEVKVGEAQDGRDNAIATTLREIVKEGLDIDGGAGLKPQRPIGDIAKDVHDSMATYVADLGVQGPEANDMLIALAKEQAELGNEDMANAILDYDRPGIGSVGSIIKRVDEIGRIRDLAADQHMIKSAEASQGPRAALSVWARDEGGTIAEATKRIEAHEAQYGPLKPSFRETIMETANITLLNNTEKFAAEELRRMRARTRSDQQAGGMSDAFVAMKNGTFHLLTGFELMKPDGTTEYRSGIQQQDEFVELSVSKIRQDTTTTQEQKDAAIFDIARKTGSTIPEWTQTLGNGFTAATPEALTRKDGTLPAAVEDSYRLWNDLWTQDKNIALKHVSDRATQDYYEAARTREQFAGYDTRTALVEAKRISSRVDYADFKVRDLDEIVTQIHSDQSSWVPFFGAVTVENAESIGNVMQRLEKLYRMSGNTPEKSYELARERLQASFSMVGNNLIYTADKNVPPDFAPLAEQLTEEYFTAFGEGEDIESADDIAITPMVNSPGMYMLYDTTSGGPVENTEKRYFSLSDLNVLRAKNAQDEREALIEKTKKNQAKEAARPKAEIRTKGGETKTVAPPQPPSLGEVLRVEEAPVTTDARKQKLLSIIEDPSASPDAKVEARKGLLLSDEERQGLVDELDVLSGRPPRRARANGKK